MTAPLDIANARYGRWTVIDRVPQNDNHGSSLWRCRCDCGTVSILAGSSLQSGNSKSCGCRRREPRTHGLWSHPLYETWRAMIKRCYDPRTNGYNKYGGRGIKVCDRWMDIRTFIADMGERPSPAHQIDRKDSAGNYEPGNCRWATPEQQRDNQRIAMHQLGKHPTNRLITAFGQTLHLSEWARRTGIRRATITYRLENNWPPERALSQ